MDQPTLERALRAVELIPPGRVASYGDLAGLVGIGPRQMGWVLRHYGRDLPWWRVTNASGDLPAHTLEEARWRWADEGIAVKPDGRGCRISDHRVDLAWLADAFDAAVVDLS